MRRTIDYSERDNFWIADLKSSGYGATRVRLVFVIGCWKMIEQACRASREIGGRIELGAEFWGLDFRGWGI